MLKVQFSLYFVGHVSMIVQYRQYTFAESCIWRAVQLAPNFFFFYKQRCWNEPVMRKTYTCQPVYNFWTLTQLDLSGSEEQSGTGNTSISYWIRTRELITGKSVNAKWFVEHKVIQPHNTKYVAASIIQRRSFQNALPKTEKDKSSRSH